MSGRSVQIIGGDAATRGFVKRALTSAGYCVAVGALDGSARRAPSTASALSLLIAGAADALGDIRRFKAAEAAPLLALLPAGAESLTSLAMAAGAEDVLVLPAQRGELVQRVRLVLSDAASDAPPLRSEYSVGELSIDVAAESVRRGEELVKLTPQEQRLLAYLAQRAGRPVSHRRLLREVWGAERIDDVLSLRVCISQLRRKIEGDPLHPRYLLTERRLGYGLTAD